MNLQLIHRKGEAELSRMHLDHSGRLPLLVGRGLRAPIYAHAATRDLCQIMRHGPGAAERKGRRD